MSFLDQLLVKLFNFNLKHSKKVLIFFSLLIIIIPFGLIKNSLTISINDFVGDHPEIKPLIHFEKSKFKSKNYLFTLFTRKDKESLNHLDLCIIKNKVEEMSRKLFQIDSIKSPFELRIIKKNQNKYYNHSAINIECQNSLSTELQNLKLNSKNIPDEFKNLFFSQSGDALGIIINLKPTKYSSFLGHFDEKPIHKIKSYFETSELKKHFQLSFGGPHYFEWVYFESLLKDHKLNIFLFFILLCVFFVLFGTLKSGFIISFLIGLGSMILFSLMGLFQFPITILTNSTIILLAFSTTEDFIFLSQNQLDKKNKTPEWSDQFREFITPSFLTSLTTIIGFGSLYISDLKSIKHFGLTVSIGAFIEWVLLFFFFPALIKHLPILQSWTKEKPQKEIPLLFNKLSFLPIFRLHRKFIIIILHATVLFAFYFIGSGKSIEDIKTTWPSNHYFSESLKRIESYLNWSTFIEINFPKDQLNRTSLNEIKRLPHVTKIEDHENFLQLGVSNIPSQSQNYFKEMLEISGTFNRYLSKDNQYIRKFVYLNTTDSILVNTIKEKIQTICKQKCILTGKAVFHAYFSKLVNHTFKYSFFICFFSISLFIFIMSKIIKSPFSLILIYSSLWGIIVFIGFVSFSLGGVSFVTSVFSACLLGLAGDNAIQFLWASRKNPKDILISLNQRKTAAIKVTIVMIACISIFLLSTFLQIKILGVLFMIGSLMLLFGDLWILEFMVNQRETTMPPPEKSNL